jgi:ABC-type nitrate/sulfonate/bicarbonate transport system substrate-binding protein
MNLRHAFALVATAGLLATTGCARADSRGLPPAPPDDATTATAPGTMPAAGATASDALTSMTFMAGFSPQANLPFVGVYVAQEQGFFADEGLDVEIQHSGGGGEHLQLLATGTVQVTTQDVAVLLERRVDPGLPLVSLALLGQTGQQAFIALEESGIATPGDWAGHTVGFKGTPPPDVFAILDAVGLSEDDVELVNVGFDPRVLTEGQVDVLPVYKSNEPDIIRGWGYDLNMWEAADFGVPTLGLTYVATEDMVTTQPDLLDGFVDAAMRGVAWAEEHRDEAVDIVLTHTGPDADRDHQRYMLDTELEAAHSEVTDEHGIGWQTEAQYRALADLLLDTGALPADLDVTDAFTTQFLETG